MRILSVTAGAAGMYCGSCFRDNALAAELLARGHDVTLVPVYTPTRTDERNVSRRHVLFGGISVYLQQHSSLFRRTPRFLDRLWDSPRLIAALAGHAISTDARLLGSLTVSMLEGTGGVLRKEFDKLIEWTRAEPLPDVVNLPNSLLISMALPLKQALGRPVCCTLQGEELFLDNLPNPYRERAIALIRSQLGQIDRFIAVSEYCADYMSSFLQIPASRIAVVPLGIGMAGYERRDTASDEQEFQVGYFARIAPEKGLLELAEAYVRLRKRVGGARMRLAVAGHLASDQRPYFDRVRSVLERTGLGHELSYQGTVDRAGKIAFLRSLDVLSVPATYDEPKGMFLLEAMACGVPVVQPRRGAFTEIVHRTGGGLLVHPDQPEALADGLHAIWSDRALATSLGSSAFEGVRAHYTVEQSAARLLEVYSEACAPGAGAPPAMPRRVGA